MAAKTERVALYLRVSTDEQTTKNQRLALMGLVERRGWNIVQVYEDAGISGAKGRDKRPGLNAAMKDATRRRFDRLVVWSIDRLGRSTAGIATALDELEALGVKIYADREGIDSSTPHGRAMLQMAGVFAKLERGMIRERVVAGMERAKAEQKAGKERLDANGNPLKAIGRPKVSDTVEQAIRDRLAAGTGILKVAREMNVGTSVVQRVKVATEPPSL